MADLIFYGTDHQTFLEEAFTKSPELVGKDDEGNYYTKYTKTPMRTNINGEFIFLVRTSTAKLGYFARLNSISNLGSYDAVLVAPIKREIYDRIYDQSPYEITEDGETIMVTPPEKFGVFL